MTAGEICDGNSTYTPDALETLNVSRDQSYSFVRCDDCSFLYAQYEPDELFLKALYESVISAPRARLESQRPAWVAHQLTLAQRLLERLSGEASARILDYGCGYGTLVRALASPAISCIGYEYSHAVARECQANGLNVLTDLEAVVEVAPFDGVILSDVLEHLSNPRSTLAECAKLLRPGGWLCVSVPDFSDRRVDTVMKERRTGAGVTRELNPWEHLNYFSPETLVTMLSLEGYRVDVYATADFGLRQDGRGLRRWGNAAKSAMRMLRFVASPYPTSTTVLAQKL